MKKFLNNEFWMLSVQGAFQRANCYHKSAGEKEKAYFRKELKSFIDNEIFPSYKVAVPEDVHLSNIQKIIDFSSTFSPLFVSGAFNIGISQKLLNLYLKYHWCTGEIPAPPHFPVDRLIQQRLEIKEIKPWTRFERPEDYLYVINYAKTLLGVDGINSLPELELKYFNRRAM